jgi:sterol desaturase/sphingolipid hydroxylase (fatty acid hydroxylase superfamily)
MLVAVEDAGGNGPGAATPGQSGPDGDAGRGTIVGRAAEREALGEALASLREGRGELLLLCGEPGIGKSTLAQWAARRAQAESLAVHWGFAWEAGGAPSYWPWIQVLRSLLADASARDALGDRHLLDASGLGVAAGATLGVLVYELAHYGYHRAAHRFGWLWRLGHQMHHSAESLDAFGANYLHPIDAAAFTSISSLVFFPLLGLDPLAGAIAAVFLTFNAMFQHANLKTPRWLGWIVQRPESHSVHHARGIHRYNYSDLPLWDLVFGTFRNPETFQDQQGFYPGASARVAEMLAFRDVTSPRSEDEDPGLEATLAA